MWKESEKVTYPQGSPVCCRNQCPWTLLGISCHHTADEGCYTRVFVSLFLLHRWRSRSPKETTGPRLHPLWEEESTVKITVLSWVYWDILLYVNRVILRSLNANRSNIASVLFHKTKSSIYKRNTWLPALTRTGFGFTLLRLSPTALTVLSSQLRDGGVAVANSCDLSLSTCHRAWWPRGPQTPTTVLSDCNNSQKTAMITKAIYNSICCLVEDPTFKFVITKWWVFKWWFWWCISLFFLTLYWQMCGIFTPNN